jgi:hypothetical protein
MSTLTQFFSMGGGGYAVTNVSIITTSGTWTQPPGVTQVCVTMCGGGGGWATNGGTSTFAGLTATGGGAPVIAGGPDVGGTGTVPGGTRGQGSILGVAGAGGYKVESGGPFNQTTTQTWAAGGASFGPGGDAISPRSAGIGTGGGVGGGNTPSSLGGGGGGLIYKQVVAVAGPVSVTIGAGGIGPSPFSDQGGPGICIVEW